jgi:small-conductance mechanosensitive channel
MSWFKSLEIRELVAGEHLLTLVRAVVLLVLGVALAKLASSGVGRLVRHRFSRQETMLVRRLVFYSILGLVLAATLHQLGFKLGVLLGAAGVLTVAIGFASQTSASNLISGLFLIAERPFVVGDIVTVEDVTGEVLSVDLLSIKLRTFDNLFVRVPNESIIKSRLTNLTRFPIRRLDMKIGVAYKENISKVREALFAVADKNPLCLDAPKPLFIFLDYGESSLDLQFSVWTTKENFLALKNSIQEEIKAAFDAAGIEIPFPHRTIYTGSETAAFPVRIVDGPPDAG